MPKGKILSNFTTHTPTPNNILIDQLLIQYSSTQWLLIALNDHSPHTQWPLTAHSMATHWEHTVMFHSWMITCMNNHNEMTDQNGHTVQFLWHRLNREDAMSLSHGSCKLGWLKTFLRENSMQRSLHMESISLRNFTVWGQETMQWLISSRTSQPWRHKSFGDRPSQNSDHL